MSFREGYFNDEEIIFLRRYKYLPHDISTQLQELLEMTPKMAAVNKLDQLAKNVNHYCYQRQAIIEGLMEKKNAIS